MSTPSIQTLITQAQQVLNLKSSNEIRATLAAVLANANVGTPLNPNLTTQQLWDEFYEIVRQPSDDIMSIITDQMMRMVFSPPAPGGAGADKQVIFNDGGVLAGDTKFLWDKNANRLDVDGPVVITGDLTVRTNKLAVTSTGVGFGTATPTGVADFLSAVVGNSNVLTIGNNEYGGTTYLNSNSVSLTFNRGQSFKTGAVVSSNITSGNLSEGYIAFQTSTGNVLTERYRIDNAGNSIWSVAGTTAMTLNSTGLGIGVSSPTAKIHITNASMLIDTLSSQNKPSIILGSAGASYGQIQNDGTGLWSLGYGASTAALGTPVLSWNSSGNVGIGVSTFGTSAAKVLSIGTGTEPTTGPAGSVQFFTSTRSASNTIPAIFTEGSGVTNAAITNTTVTNKIAIKVNGTIYYLLATTSAA